MTDNLEVIFGKWEGFPYIPRMPTNTKVQVYGINDAPFVVQPTISGKQVRHPAYITWNNILRRCYNAQDHVAHPTYIGASCCDDWLLFTNFATWFSVNFIPDYQLDKDLLVRENKIYSPETCVYVPGYINKFITTRHNYRGELPIGVTAHITGKFQAQINNGTGRHKHLGLFNTKEQAHKAWQLAKLEQAIAFNFPPLKRVIDQLKFEIENNLETTSL